MFRFNPEKELKKIQHGGRNRFIFISFLLLVIAVVGTSYAFYQVRYSRRIIYTRVKINRKDIELAVKVEGETENRKEFPNRNEGLIYSGITCDTEGITTATWNYGTWSLDLNSTGPNKCTISFKKKPTTTGTLSSLCIDKMPLNECMQEHGLEVANIVIDETEDGNLRYIGATPNNYIWYNCKSYDSLTNSNATDTTHDCEKWRIIGLINVVEVTNYRSTDRVKIIRAESIGSRSWHSSAVNNWAKASLNTSFLNSTSYYLKNGYTWTDSNSVKQKGITTASKAMIQSVVWDLGGPTSNASTTSQFYEAERSTTVYGSNANHYDNLIGLMYPSDYGYATSGGVTYNRQECLDYILSEWDGLGYKEDCVGNDWLFISNRSQFTISPLSQNSSSVFSVFYSGDVYGSDVTSNSYAVRPSLYLTSSVKIKSGEGDGSSTNPYILIP